MKSIRQPLISLILAAVAAAAGCSEELGPEQFRTTTVTGQVIAMGRPVGPGWIEFIPVEGTTGNMRTARLDAEGRFKVDRVPVGRVAVAFAHLGKEMIPTAVGSIAARFFVFSNSPIRMTIPDGPDARITVDLDVEAVKIRREQERVERLRQSGQGQGTAP